MPKNQIYIISGIAIILIVGAIIALIGNKSSKIETIAIPSNNVQQVILKERKAKAQNLRPNELRGNQRVPNKHAQGNPRSDSRSRQADLGVRPTHHGIQKRLGTQD